VRGMYEQWKQWADGQRHSLIAGRPGTPTIQHWLEHRDREPDILSRPTVPITTASILPSGMYRIWIDSVDWGRVLSGAVGQSRLYRPCGKPLDPPPTGQLEELAEDPISHYLRPVICRL
jgi:hypothetical protein